jgi:hypothetical protein
MNSTPPSRRLPTLAAAFLTLAATAQNIPPIVTISRTPSSATVEPGTTLTLTATAIDPDPDGSIQQVEFLANGSVFATASAPPFRTRVTVRTPGAYRFSAQATDIQNASATTPDLTATVPPATTPPTLTVTDNLQLWLSAEAGVTATPDGEVNSWFDLSGNANDAFQANPAFAPAFVENTLAGLPTVRFDGVDDFLDVSDSPSISIPGDVTSVVVLKIDDLTTAHTIWAKSTLGLPAPTDFHVLPDSGLPRLARGDGRTNSAFLDGGSPLPAGAFHIAGFSASNSIVTHFLNGQVTARGPVNSPTADLDSPLRIGARDDLASHLKGDLAELLVYNTNLPPEDIDRIQLYLGEKYGIGILAPTNTPPSIELTSPAPNAVFPAPATIELTATATDPDGSVVRVDFLLNGALAASTTTNPFSTTITLPAADASTVTAIAHDNLGARSEAAPVAFSVSSSSPTTLPSPAHLKLWLKADAGVTQDNGVTTWEDQSGNLNHATQPTPGLRPQFAPASLNALPTLHFDGADDFLEIPHAITLAMVRDLSSFAVVRLDDFNTPRTIWAKTDASLPRPTDHAVLADSGLPRTTRGGPQSTGFVNASSPLAPGEFAIVGFDTAGSTLRHWLNGEPNGEGSIDGPFADAAKPLRIGSRDTGDALLRGNLAELILYNTSLSDADRSSVIAYLAAKYAIGDVPQPPRLTATRSTDGSRITLSWPTNTAGYILQSTDRIPDGAWQPVPDTADNTATIPIGPGPAYFRLARP